MHSLDRYLLSIKDRRKNLKQEAVQLSTRFLDRLNQASAKRLRGGDTGTARSDNSSDADGSIDDNGDSSNGDGMGTASSDNSSDSDGSINDNDDSIKILHACVGITQQ